MAGPRSPSASTRPSAADAMVHLRGRPLPPSGGNAAPSSAGHGGEARRVTAAEAPLRPDLFYFYDDYGKPLEYSPTAGFRYAQAAAPFRGHFATPIHPGHFIGAAPDRAMTVSKVLHVPTPNRRSVTHIWLETQSDG